MSYLVVITFETADEAERVRQVLHKQQDQGYLSLDDSAVIIKDAEGKVHVKNETDRGVKIGALGGGFLGLLLAGLFFPIAGLTLGALGGAALGKMLGGGEIDKQFIQDVTIDLRPGPSAIFIVVRSADPGVAVTTLSQFKGKIYHTSLPSEAEESLRKALKDNA